MIHAFSNYIDKYNIVKLFTRIIRLLFKIVYLQKKSYRSHCNLNTMMKGHDAPIKKIIFCPPYLILILRKILKKSLQWPTQVYSQCLPGVKLDWSVM